MLNEFCKYLKEQYNNKSIYVLGAQGQTGNSITEKWIKEREHNVKSNYNRAIKLWKSRKDKYPKLRAFDCSGLAVYWLLKNNVISSDMTAHGLYDKCKKISKISLLVGDWCFKVSEGRAHHIGYVVDFANGKPVIISAKGRADGVVKGETGWNAYGRPKYFEAEIEKSLPCIVFDRNLKRGMRGKDVARLKDMLIDHGFLKSSKNDIFGVGTVSAVKSAQKEYKLKIDGIAGKNTIVALGGKWKA